MHGFIWSFKKKEKKKQNVKPSSGRIVHRLLK